MKQKLTIGGGVIVVAAIIWTATAFGWSPPALTIDPVGCETVIVTVHNPEGGAATVTASNVFTVGSVIPGHGDLSKQITGTGTLHVTVTVDFPDHASASTDVHFQTCPRETTTTTVPDETTTTQPPTTHTMNPGPPPVDVVQPKFTG